MNPALDRATVTGMHRLAFTLAPRLLVALLPTAAGLTVAGCFTTGGNTTPDAGEVIPDGSTVLPDGAGQLPVGDGGPCLVATSVPMSQVPGYVSVHQQLNACSSTQLTTFVSACVATTAMPGPCNTFQTDTANKGCMGCLFPGTPGSPTENSGGMLVDSTGTIIVAVNTPGCIALANPANGPACASAIEPPLPVRGRGLRQRRLPHRHAVDLPVVRDDGREGRVRHLLRALADVVHRGLQRRRRGGHRVRDDDAGARSDLRNGDVNGRRQARAC